MALLNFQKRFVPMIESGRKTHTIRADRKHPIKKGETLYLYTGLRQKGARKILEAPCTKVEQIEIRYEAGVLAAVVIDGVTLSHSERAAIAYRDGFEDFLAMFEFWEDRLPFSGQVIHWKAI